MASFDTLGVKGYPMLLLQPLLARRQAGSLWASWLLLFATVLALVAFGWHWHDWRAGMLGAAVMLTALTFMWWLAFLGTAIAQNAPTHAWLAPGLHRRLVATAAMLWSAATLVLGALFGMALGHVGYAVLACGAGLMFIAAVQNLIWLSFAPVVFVVADRFVSFGPVAARLAALGEPALTAAGLPLLLALGILTLRRVFPRGGDRHHAWQRRYADRAAASKLAGALPGADVIDGEKPSRWRDVLYFAGLRRIGAPCRDLTRAANRADALLFGLGTGSHWGASVLTQLCAIVIVTAAGSETLGGNDPRGAALMFCTTLLVTPLLAHVYTLLSAMQRYRGEQALLRLSPAAPDTAAFNRQLGSALLRRYLTVWLATSIGTLVVTSVLLPGNQPRTAVAATAALSLLFGAFLLRDYSALRRLRLAMGIAIALLVLASIALRMLLATNRQGVPWWFTGSLALFGLAVLALRWRAMWSMPPAFPAARQGAGQGAD